MNLVKCQNDLYFRTEGVISYVLVSMGKHFAELGKNKFLWRHKEKLLPAYCKLKRHKAIMSCACCLELISIYPDVKIWFGQTFDLVYV